MKTRLTDACPASATHGVVATLGFLGLVAGVLFVRTHPFDHIVTSAIFVTACTAVGVFVPDLFWQKVHRRVLGPPQAADVPRALTKVAGLIASLVFVAAIYKVFPEYFRPGTFYRNYWTFLRFILPIWLIAAVPYIFWVDRRLREPYDALWQLGCVVTGRWRAAKGEVVGQYLLGWLVKGYFLPLMFTYLCNDLARMQVYDLRTLTSFQRTYDFLYFALYFCDVALVSMTYLMSLKLTDTHIRSAEPTVFGWVTAIICYQPFWSLIGGQYLDYETGYPWGAWLHNTPVFYTIWGSAILALTAIYLWATIVFGGRFSNLTHRGIITNGPYRYTKHPAYIAKNLSWWLISTPFMAQGTTGNTLRRCTLLLMLNTVYYLRAKTEERHLSVDPAYVAYANWIDRHGLLRFLNGWPFVGRIVRWRPQFGTRPLTWLFPAKLP